MGFDALLGNEQLKENLSAARRKGRLSHFYLLSGPRGSGKHTLADLIAAAMLCAEPDGPCGVCRSCRKILGGSHPDYITVDAPDKKIIPVQLVRDIRADVYIKPNEGARKIYLFPRAQDLNTEGQNTLLKILEEPPPYGVFLLLTDNPEKLLPTVRSRCTELSLSALPQSLVEQELARRFPQSGADERSAAAVRSGGFLGQAMTLMAQEQSQSPQTELFIKAFASRDVMSLLQALVPMEKWKRDQLIPELTIWVQLLHDALLQRSGAQAVSPLARQVGESRSSRDIMRSIRHLQKAIEYTQGNVSVAAVCGWLEWALR